MPSTTRPCIALLLMASLFAFDVAAQQAPSGDVVQRRLLRHCGRLIWQFDGTVIRLPLTASVERAKLLRKEGERFCNRANPKRGVPLLEESLYQIGINPIARP